MDGAPAVTAYACVADWAFWAVVRAEGVWCVAGGVEERESGGVEERGCVGGAGCTEDATALSTVLWKKSV